MDNPLKPLRQDQVLLRAATLQQAPAKAAAWKCVLRTP